MKSLLKLGIFAFAFGLFATACNPSTQNQNTNDQSTPSMDQEVPTTAPSEMAPGADTLNTPGDTTNSMDSPDM